jgi:hypothetical protein
MVVLLLPSSTEINNEWSCTSAPPIHLQTRDRINFIFYPSDRMTCTSHDRSSFPARSSKTRLGNPLARNLATIPTDSCCSQTHRVGLRDLNTSAMGQGWRLQRLVIYRKNRATNIAWRTGGVGRGKSAWKRREGSYSI